MRFIRVHGRIVPIKDNGGSQPRAKAVAKAPVPKTAEQHDTAAHKFSVAQGAGLAGGFIGLREAAIHATRGSFRASKGGVAFGAAATAVSLGAGIGGIYHAVTANKMRHDAGATYGERLRINTKNNLKDAGAQIAGGLAAWGAYKGIINHGSKLRPLAQKVGDAFRFYKASPVKAGRVIAGLLT